MKLPLKSMIECILIKNAIGISDSATIEEHIQGPKK
jgi:hypothetical protein